MITSIWHRFFPKRKTNTGLLFNSTIDQTDHKAAIVPVQQHKIDPSLISRNAIKVISALQQAGYQAYIVGGAVRDLLLGIAPKDFDVATNATPEQVQALFRRARLIGRRFQIVHVVFHGMQVPEIIEVSTFRALVEAQASIQVKDRPANSWFKKSSRRRDLDRHTHAIDARGRVLRDNVWGKQIEDAARRDFTVNALYYDPADQTVHDYHHGLADIRAKLLRMIGDPPTRYREDPVRMLRAVRFAAKTGFAIDPKTAGPIKELAHLIHHVPTARVFDELLKLLFCGHAWVAIQQLQQLGFSQSMLTLLDVILDQSDHGAFIKLAFADTDTRVMAGKPVSPGFLFAALLWHAVQNDWQARIADNMLPIPALHEAIDAVLAKRIGQLGIQRRHISDMKQIWLLQPRFERRTGQAPLRLLETPRFRAAYDFLLLRARVGEVSAELGDWWTAFQKANAAERNMLLVAITSAQTSVQEGEGGSKRRKRRRRVKADNCDNPTETGLVETSSRGKQ